MDKMQRLVIFFLLCTSLCYSQDGIDFSKISKEKIVFEGVQSVMDEEFVKNILLLGIDITLNNIANARTTRTSVGTPYKYHYILVRSDLSFIVMEKGMFKLEYDPIHPDAIKCDSNLVGYVRYPDIDIKREYDDIIAMVNLLKDFE